MHFSRLAVETFHEICIATLEPPYNFDDPHPLDTLRRLSQISSRSREIVNYTSSFWASVLDFSVLEPRTKKRNHHSTLGTQDSLYWMNTVLRRVDLGLQNGRAIPLTVTAVLHEHNYTWLCPILTRYLPHIRSLHLSIHPECGSEPETIELLTSPAPKLEFLQLQYYELSDKAWLCLPEEKLELFGGKAHLLKEVDIENVPFVLSASQSTSLRNLRVVEERYHTLSTKGLYDFLAHAPSLESLEFEGLLYEAVDGPSLTLSSLNKIQIGTDIDAAVCILEAIIPGDGCSLRLSAGQIYQVSMEHMHHNLIRLSNSLVPFVNDYFKSQPEAMYILDSGGALRIRNSITKKPSLDDSKYFFRVYLELGPNGSAGTVILNNLRQKFDFSIIRNFLLEKDEFDASGRRVRTRRWSDPCKI